MRRSVWHGSSFKRPYRVQLLIVHRCLDQVGTGKVGTTQVGLGQVEGGQVGSAQVGIAQIDPLQVGILGVPRKVGVGGTYPGPAQVSRFKGSGFDPKPQKADETGRRTPIPLLEVGNKEASDAL